MIYKESMTSDFFMKWFSEELLPSLSETHVIVMDNATFHPKTQLDELCIEHHHFFLPLPPYSPELNPIETAWANLKKAIIELYSIETRGGQKCLKKSIAIWQYFSKVFFDVSPDFLDGIVLR